MALREREVGFVMASVMLTEGRVGKYEPMENDFEGGRLRLNEVLEDECCCFSCRRIGKTRNKMKRIILGKYASSGHGK